MSEWKEYILEQITEPVKDTYNPTGNDDLIYIGLEHIDQGALRLNSLGHSTDITSNKFQFKKDDILFGKLRSYFRKVVKTSFSGICSTDIWVFRAKDGFSQDFLFNFLANWDFIDTASGGEGGTRMPRADWRYLRQSKWFLPPLPEQKAIAAVLSSLDDKIDLLHRQNKTLEAMAEALFRQWFIEEADEGWEEVPLEHVTKRITDGAHTSPPSNETGKPMASVKDMYDWGIDVSTCRRISEKDYIKLVQDDCKPLKDDILIAKDGSYLKYIFVVKEDMELVILSSIAIIRPNGKYHPFLLSILLKLDSTIELLKNIVTGAVIPRIVLKDFRKFPIVLPPVESQKKALSNIKPIIEKCWENDMQIYLLKKLRDTLLPKLISGEIKIKE